MIVGDATYHATPTPVPVTVVGGGGLYASMAGPSRSISGNGETGHSTGSNSGDVMSASSTGVMPYQGSATRRVLDWKLLWGLSIIGLFLK